MRRRDHNLLAALSLHVALGGKIAPWAAERDINERTARDWAKLPEFKTMVAAHRRLVVDRAVGMLVRSAAPAVQTMRKLAKEGKSESIRLAASKALTGDLVALSSFLELGQEIDGLREDVAWLKSQLEASGDASV